jgi:hypothetical protein
LTSQALGTDVIFLRVRPLSEIWPGLSDLQQSLDSPKSRKSKSSELTRNPVCASFFYGLNRDARVAPLKKFDHDPSAHGRLTVKCPDWIRPVVKIAAIVAKIIGYQKEALDQSAVREWRHCRIEGSNSGLVGEFKNWNMHQASDNCCLG